MSRILIADDNKDIVDILKRFAAKENLQVDVAYNGKKH